MMSRKTIHEFSITSVGYVRFIEDEAGNCTGTELDFNGHHVIELGLGQFKALVYDLDRAKEFLMGRKREKQL